MSTNLLPNELIQWLPYSETILKVSQLSGGLIHRTYVVRTASESILLQSINTQIFSEPTGLIQNHRALYQHFQAPRSPFALAMPLPFSNDAWIVQDDQGASWRLSQFIAGTHTLHEVESPAQAEALAQFFARFTRHAADPKDPHWAIPIAKFHDLTPRFNQFQTSLSSGMSFNLPESNQTIEKDLQEIGPTILYAPSFVFKHIITSISYRIESASESNYNRYMSHYKMLMEIYDKEVSGTNSLIDKIKKTIKKSKKNIKLKFFIIFFIYFYLLSLIVI